MTAEAGQTNEGTSSTPVAAVQQASEAVDVSTLSDRDIKWRARCKLKTEELESVKARTDKERSDLNTTIGNLNKERQGMEQKLIDAKLENAAITAGINDVDFVKLIDRSSIKIDENGNYVGLREAVEAFKASKPACFGVAKQSSTSTNAAVPTQEQAKPMHASKMTDAEWAKAKRDINSRKRF